MFQRQSAKPTDLKPLFERSPPLGALPLAAVDTTIAPPMPPSPPMTSSFHSSGSDGTRPRSVIGNDLTISGQQLSIVSRGALQIDGQIQGDVRGAEVIIGEQGKVEGSIYGEQVTVRGTALGVVRGINVALMSGSRVEGDVHHASLSIEQGAMFEGRARRQTESAIKDAAAEVVPVPSPAPTGISGFTG